MGVTAAQIRLAETDLVKSPALYGLVRLRLLLPTGMLSQFNAAELRHIFLHELAHVKRRDMGILWLVTLCKILHWFNPVLWFGFRRMAADRELACDELALSHAGERDCSPYGETILKLLEFYARPAAAVPGLMGILEEKDQMRRRITMIAKFKQPSRWSALAPLLLLVVGLVTLTDAQSDKPDAISAQKDTTGEKASYELTKTTQDSQNAIAAYEKDPAAGNQRPAESCRRRFPPGRSLPAARKDQ